MRVNGSPASDSPADASYTVTKFIRKDVKQLDFSVYDLEDSDFVEEYTIASTIDPRDLERSYRSFLGIFSNDSKGKARVHWTLTDQMSNFSKKRSPQSYLLQFQEHVKNILNPPMPEREEAPNAHVERRRKKKAVKS